MPFKLFILLLSFVCRAHALDAFETQVYDSGINEIGKKSLEIHFNNILSGRTEPEYAEQIPAQHLTHTTLEFALGLTRFWEFGAYLQSALTPDSQIKYAGAKLRSKFVIPKGESGPFQFGVNFEISSVPKAFESVQYGAKLRPIFGYQYEHLLFLINPILGFNLFEQGDANPMFSPASKIMIDTQRGFGAGLEYYSDFGSTNRFLALPQAEQYLYLVFDQIGAPFELNIGVGQGLNSASNRYALKAIFGFEF